MSTDTNEPTVEGTPVLTRDEAGVLMGVGVLLAIIGLLAVLFPLVSGVAISIFIGAALIVGGLSYVASAFTASGWTSVVGRLLLALVYAGAGIIALVNPTVTLTTLTLLLIGYFILEGLVLMGLGLASRSEQYWGLTVASGAFSLLVAALVWLGLPSSAAWAIGLLFGINLLVTGGTMAVVGRGYRKAAPTAPTTTAEPGTGGV